jgi:putative addiction module killer protein
MTIDVKVYTTEDGHLPFREWVEKLRDIQARAQITVRLNRVRMGNLGDHRAVGQGVSELRIPHGPGYRVYFGRHGDTIVIILCGGDKSSQARDIELAQSYWKDYLRRMK